MMYDVNERIFFVRIVTNTHIQLPFLCSSYARAQFTRVLVHLEVEIERVHTRIHVQDGFVVDIVTRTLYRCKDVQKFINEFRGLVKTLKERVERVEGEESRMSKKIVRFANFLHQRIFLKDHEDCEEGWLQRMFVGIVNAMLEEIIRFMPSDTRRGTRGFEFVRQVLNDFLGIQSLAECNFAERKLFTTSLHLARSRGPLWSEVYLRNGTTTDVIVGQLPYQWQVQMLHRCRNVRSVLSVCEPYELEEVDGRSAWHIPGIVQKQICVQDFRGGGGIGALREGVDFIERQLSLGSVYVHCKAGKGRSVLMVMAWLMKYQSAFIVSPVDALHTIIMHRPHINPDTLITHAKVKEAHMYWLCDVLGVSKILEDGVVLLDATFWDTEKWLNASIGAGFFSNDTGGYLHARDVLVKWYGGAVMAQKLRDDATPPHVSLDEADGADSDTLSDLWDRFYGVHCGDDNKRLKEMMRRNKSERKFKRSVMLAQSLYEKKFILPLIEVSRMIRRDDEVTPRSCEIRIYSTTNELKAPFSVDNVSPEAPSPRAVKSMTRETLSKLWDGTRRVPTRCDVVLIRKPTFALYVKATKEKNTHAKHIFLSKRRVSNVEYATDSCAVTVFDDDFTFVMQMTFSRANEASSFAREVMNCTMSKSHRTSGISAMSSLRQFASRRGNLRVDVSNPDSDDDSEVPVREIERAIS